MNDDEDSITNGDLSVAIAHDYLQQTGGAERVVAEWSSVVPASPIHTLASDATSTYPIFGDRRIIATLGPGAPRVEYLLPLLPHLARRTVVSGADVALVSTSGWAHQFDFRMPTVAYVHTPARWLYAEADYRKKLSRLGRTALTLFGSSLRRADSPTMSRMNMLFANSRVTQERIRRVYGLDSEILHPPVTAISDRPVRPSSPVPDRFALVVSRNRGYKNSRLAIEAARSASIPIVIVGRGSEEFESPREGVHGIGFVSDSELKWLYKAADVVVGSSHEDFGLTPLEANLEGTPVAVIPRGGYLETVVDGVNGSIAVDESPEALGRAILESAHVAGSDARRHAKRFSLDEHFAILREGMRAATS